MLTITRRVTYTGEEAAVQRQVERSLTEGQDYGFSGVMVRAETVPPVDPADAAENIAALRADLERAEAGAGRPVHPMAEAHYELAVAALRSAEAQLRLARYHEMRGD